MTEATPLYLVSQRLIIRQYQPGDLSQYMKKMQEASLRPAFEADIIHVFNRRLEQTVGSGNSFPIAAFDMRAEGRLVLDMSFVPMRVEEGNMGIGYYTLRDYRHQGYMTEALRTVLSHLITKHGIQQVTAIIDPHNIYSIKTAIKAGFRRPPGSVTKFVFGPGA